MTRSHGKPGEALPCGRCGGAMVTCTKKSSTLNDTLKVRARGVVLVVVVWVFVVCCLPVYFASP